MSQLKSYFRMLTFISPYKGRLFLSLTLSVLFALSSVYAMPLIRDITQQLANKNLTYFTNHVFNALLLYSVRLASQYGQLYVMTFVSNKMLIDIRMALYRKLHSLSQDFFSKWKSGDIITRVFSDSHNIQGLILSSFENFFPQILSFIGVCGYLFYLNWKLTLCALVGIPIFIQIVSYFAKQLKRVMLHAQIKTSDMTQLLQESIQNMKMVQSFGLQDRGIKRFSDQHYHLLGSKMREVRFKCTQEPMIAFLQFVVMLGIVWYGGYEVLNGTLTSPELISFFTGVVLLIDNVVSLTKGFTQAIQMMASVDRVFDVLDVKVTIQNLENPVTTDLCYGALAFKNVSFYYNKESEKVIDNISLNIQAAETIALVGLSGAGKSTFINLISRFYDVTDGSITLDGTDLRELDLEFLRRNVSLVPQDPFLFRGTILENVRFGRPDATIEEIDEALKMASAYDFVYEMPDKYLTKIGDQGRRLSGGQKQRLAIARAFLKDAKILLLDEATSSLDSQSEGEIRLAIRQLMKDRTTIVIAHRLSTVIDADRIVVLKKGSVEEVGTHQELLKNKGHYEMLYNLQFKELLDG